MIPSDQWLRFPRDAVDRAQAPLAMSLYYFLLLLAVGNFLFALVSTVLTENSMSGFLLGLVGFGSVTLIMLLRRGYFTVTAYGTVAGIWLVVTLVTWWVQPLDHAMVMAYLGLLVFSRVLLPNERDAYGVAVLCGIGSLTVLALPVVSSLLMTDLAGFWLYVMSLLLFGFVYLVLSRQERPPDAAQQGMPDADSAVIAVDEATVDDDGVVSQDLTMEQLYTVFQESLDVLLIIDENELIQRVNITVKEILGYDPNEIIGKPLTHLLPGDSVPIPFVDDDAVVYDALPFQCADGTVLEMELTATLISWEDSLGILLTLRDVSRRETIRRELAKAKEVQANYERERELLRARENIIFVIAHQLRNPLAGIQMSAEILDRYKSRLKDDQIAAHARKIGVQTRALTRMMENMLTARDAMMGKLRFSPEPNVLGDICRPLFEQIVALRAMESHTYQFEDATDGEMALLDEELLTYIVDNLVSNAFKYSPQGGEVIMQLERHADEYIITVTDEGIGIPEAAREDIFELFVRADNVGEIRGTGIGLGLVHKSAVAHGGYITLETAIGEGATFRVHIPYLAPDDVDSFSHTELPLGLR